MELVYAALLLHESGKEVNEENLEGVLEGAGIDVDSSQVKAAVAALEDVDLEEAMSQPAAAPAPSDSGGEADGGETGGSEEEPEEDETETPEEEGASEEEAAEGLGSLF